MKVLLIYDSFFGNTERIALAIADYLAGRHDIVVRKAMDVGPNDYDGVELIIIGSPTRGFRPTEAITNILKKIKIKEYKWIVFDTGFKYEDIKPAILKFMAKHFGYAASNMVKTIEKAGGKLLIQPGTFNVVASEGPLLDGEIDRFEKWLEPAGL